MCSTDLVLTLAEACSPAVPQYPRVRAGPGKIWKAPKWLWSTTGERNTKCEWKGHQKSPEPKRRFLRRESNIFVISSQTSHSSIVRTKAGRCLRCRACKLLSRQQWANSRPPHLFQCLGCCAGIWFQVYKMECRFTNGSKAMLVYLKAELKPRLTHHQSFETSCGHNKSSSICSASMANCEELLRSAGELDLNCTSIQTFILQLICYIVFYMYYLCIY